MNEAIRTPTIADYISLARPHYWFKHIFIVPGLVMALFFVPFDFAVHIPAIICGIISACLISSSNYVINEWLDAEFDRHHPSKQNRPAVSGIIKPHWVFLEYAALSTGGFFLAWQVSELFLFVTLLFWISGICYNVNPLRTKDKVYFDVLSEALNNPIRLLLGWGMLVSDTLPPMTILLSYWFAGAFLMSCKRFAEYRYIVSKSGKDALALYRRSFSKYTEDTLLLSCFTYAVLAVLFIGVFLTKYRYEYILVTPFLIGLFVYYMRLSLGEHSIAQSPEELYKDKGLLIAVALLAISFVAMTIIDLPLLSQILDQRYVYGAN